MHVPLRNSARVRLSVLLLNGIAGETGCNRPLASVHVFLHSLPGLPYSPHALLAGCDPVDSWKSFYRASHPNLFQTSTNGVLECGERAPFTPFRPPALPVYPTALAVGRIGSRDTTVTLKVRRSLAYVRSLSKPKLCSPLWCLWDFPHIRH